MPSPFFNQQEFNPIPRTRPLQKSYKQRGTTRRYCLRKMEVID